MDCFKKRLSNRLLYIVVICLIFIYLVLSWQQVVPSVLNIPVIRSLWDKQFSECMAHIKEEATLPLESRAPVYVTAKLSGRLGNWMFAYASLLGIAKRNNLDFYTRPDADPRVSLKKVFKVKNVKSLSPICSQSIYEKLPCAYDFRMELLPFSNITIHGYLQSWKYFKDAEMEVRNEFQFHDHILSEAKKILRFHINKIDKSAVYQTTCVHVRRTDMMIPTSIKIGFKSASLQYILNAVQYFRDKFDNKVKFVVISDDMQWCRKYLQFSDTVIIPKNSKEIDLALLSLCNNTIITTGTFGWWGAWLANGHTVYYKNYPEPGTRLDRDTVREDFYPAQWVPMDSAIHQTQSFIFVFLFSIVVLLIIQ